MCLLLNKRLNYKRINHPLTVFKVGRLGGRDEFQSQIFKHIYKVGEEQLRITIKQHKIGVNLWAVLQGYHSYSQALKIVNEELCFSIIGKKSGSWVDSVYDIDGNTRIGIFEIPAGTRFLMDEEGIVVSDTITLKKIVTVREFIEKGIC